MAQRVTTAVMPTKVSGDPFFATEAEAIRQALNEHADELEALGFPGIAATADRPAFATALAALTWLLNQPGISELVLPMQVVVDRLYVTGTGIWAPRRSMSATADPAAGANWRLVAGFQGQASSVSSDNITDATDAGRRMLTAQNAAAQRALLSNPAISKDQYGVGHPAFTNTDGNAGLYQWLITQVLRLASTTPALPTGAAEPTVTGFLPASAAVGANITITGSGFTKATSVSFNGTTASFQVINSTTIQAVVPVGATTGPVAVSNGTDTGTSAASFTVNVPVATNRLPVADAGQDVTIQLPTSSVALMGTASDPDQGDTLTYAWRQVTGPNGAIGLPATTLNVVASGLVAGTYQFGFRSTDNHGAQSVEDYVLVTVQAASSKPKRVVPLGDSLVNSVLTTTSLLAARFQGTSLTIAPAISYPGQSTKEYLNGHMAQVQAALNSAYDDYALVSLNTNDLNQDNIETVKANNLAFINALLTMGYKGVIWMDVAACRSAYAYAIDANGAIIGTTIADREAGFDSARKAANAYLRTLIGSKLLAVGDLSVYPNVYVQANASDTRYFYAYQTGPYGTGEPGRVHFTNDYGAPYWAEAAAQAIYRGIGIAPSPATITIPDAPATGGGGTTPPTYLPNPYLSDYQTTNANAAYQDAHWQRVSGGAGWNVTVTSKLLVEKAPTGSQEVNILFAQPRNANIPGSNTSSHESVMLGFGSLANFSETGFDWYSGNFYNDVNSYAAYRGGNKLIDVTLGSGAPLFNIKPSASVVGQFDVTWKIGGYTAWVATTPLTFPLIAACTLFSMANGSLEASEAPPVSIGSDSTKQR